MGLPIKIPFPQWLIDAEVSILTGLGRLKHLWGIWNLRSFILFSLSLQVFLIFLAPFRKKTANSLHILSIWLAYLLADYVAIQAVGLIPNYNAKTTITSTNKTHPDLLAFWAPFLLVHLGGPDPITALALEDNELWTRTALHLITYISATGRVFFQSLPTNLLSIPTILMFFAGLFKYAERVMSLYNARLTQFKTSMLDKPDPGPNYAKLMESYDSYLNSSLPARFDTNPEPDQYNNPALDRSKTHKNDVENNEEPNKELDTTTNNNTQEVNAEGTSWERLKKHCFFWRMDKKDLENVELVRAAHEYFEQYKGLYVDLIFTFHDRRKSRAYFLGEKQTAEKIFTVLEIELNFTYEVFYTKMIVIHKNYGVYLRRASLFIEVTCLLIWILFIDKRLFEGIDIRITYILLVGAIVIDLISFVIRIVSDWQLAMLNKESVTRAYLYDKLLSSRSRSWGKFSNYKEAGFVNWIRRLLFRRWSESIFKFNLITYCVDRPKGFSKIFFKVPVVKDKCEGLKYVSKTWFANGLRDFIYNELRYKAEIAEDPKDAEDICDSKGDWVLRSLAGLDFEPSLFYQWTTDVEYDEALLLWHIATELLYEDVDDKLNDDDLEKEFRIYCKTLSDYMMYLLNRQPILMFAVAGISDVRFRDTCAEAVIFFDRVLPKAKPNETKEYRHKLACSRMMDVNTETKPKDIKGDRSKSVMFDAVRLAKQLKELKEPKSKRPLLIGMWEVIAKVWVELLSYSATHCRASAHAAQLKQGGELLTLVWLLMMHFGLGKQFRVNQGNARSKLIISK